MLLPFNSHMTFSQGTPNGDEIPTKWCDFKSFSRLIASVCLLPCLAEVPKCLNLLIFGFLNSLLLKNRSFDRLMLRKYGQFWGLLQYLGTGQPSLWICTKVLELWS